jgi:hypothetical protein
VDSIPRQDNFIVTAYGIISETLAQLEHQSHKLARLSDAEILAIAVAIVVTIVVMSAQHFQNHQEQALCLMVKTGYVAQLSVSRCNRRIHDLADAASLEQAIRCRLGYAQT